MKWVFRIVAVLLLVGGWLAAARAVHVVQSTDPATGKNRFGIVPKARWVFDQTFVDARGWTASDLHPNAALVRHLVRSGKGNLLDHVVPAGERPRAASWLIAALDDPASTQPTAPPTTGQARGD
jgi:hypothetical protein